MDKENFAKEKFKSALSSTAKAVSGNLNLEIKFGDKTSSENNSLYLPDIINLKNLNDYINIRALADSESLRIKYTDKNTYLKNEPRGVKAKALYALAEKIRYEKIGSEELKGIKKNIINSYENKFKEKKIEEIRTETDVTVTDAFELYLRSHFFKIKENQVSKKILSHWKDLFDKKIKKNLNNLDKNLNDQKIFADIISNIIDDLGLVETNDEKTQEENSKTSDKQEELNSDKNEQDSSDEKTDEQKFTLNPSLADSEVDFNSQKEDDEQLGVEDADLSQKIGPRQNKFKTKDIYKVYTEKFDEISKAEDLENNEELIKLRKNLEQQLTVLQNFISKLANKLQRQLLARQNRSWEFDLEEGTLDTSKLTRIIIDPYHSLSYKKEKKIEFKDTVVTILIDNSGSMRGRPISIAAICADVLSRTLERCSVKVEILGFTTKKWKGGESRESWNLNNKPNKPGRLNDLRHIIYKSADSPWRQTKKNMGLMLKEGILKENIDGEAILWAFKRILKRKEERKIIMVISDGAPVDDSTLSVNSGDYLEKHLKQTVKLIEEQSDVEIVAVGIGHDVTRYYKKAVKISDVQELGDVMINQLTELFTNKKNIKIN